MREGESSTEVTNIVKARYNTHNTGEKFARRRGHEEKES